MFSHSQTPKVAIGNLKNGEPVYDRHNSHLHPKVTDLLPMALKKIETLTEKFSVVEIKFDSVIGKSVCVETHDNDLIVYATRKGRSNPTRFVINREPVLTDKVTVILKKNDDLGYVLIDAFIGPLAEPQPWDRNATNLSVPFWKKHALLLDSVEVNNDGITTPYTQGEENRVLAAATQLNNFFQLFPQEETECSCRC